MKDRKQHTTVALNLRIPKGDAGIHALRAVLKLMWRRYGLKAISISEVGKPQ